MLSLPWFDDDIKNVGSIYIETLQKQIGEKYKDLARVTGFASFPKFDSYNYRNYGNGNYKESRAQSIHIIYSSAKKLSLMMDSAFFDGGRGVADEGKSGLIEVKQTKEDRVNGGKSILSKLMHNLHFQEAIKEVIRYLIEDGVESRFEVKDGKVGYVKKGEASSSISTSERTKYLFQYEVLGLKEIPGKEENSEIIVHSHPVSVYKGGKIEVVDFSIPSYQDLKVAQEKGGALSVIIWGEEGFGYYATVVDVKKVDLGNYQETLEELEKNKAVNFYCLIKDRNNGGYIFKEINLDGIRKIIAQFENGISKLEEVQKLREARWEEQAYRYYLEHPKEAKLLLLLGRSVISFENMVEKPYLPLENSQMNREHRGRQKEAELRGAQRALRELGLNIGEVDGGEIVESEIRLDGNQRRELEESNFRLVKGVEEEAVEAVREFLEGLKEEVEAPSSSDVLKSSGVVEDRENDGGLLDEKFNNPFIQPFDLSGKSPEFRNNQIEARNLHDGGLTI